MEQNSHGHIGFAQHENLCCKANLPVDDIATDQASRQWQHPPSSTSANFVPSKGPWPGLPTTSSGGQRYGVAGVVAPGESGPSSKLSLAPPWSGSEVHPPAHPHNQPLGCVMSVNPQQQPAPPIQSQHPHQDQEPRQIQQAQQQINEYHYRPLPSDAPLAYPSCQPQFGSCRPETQPQSQVLPRPSLHQQTSCRNASVPTQAQGRSYPPIQQQQPQPYSAQQQQRQTQPHAQQPGPLPQQPASCPPRSGSSACGSGAASLATSAIAEAQQGEAHRASIHAAQEGMRHGPQQPQQQALVQAEKLQRQLHLHQPQVQAQQPHQQQNQQNQQNQLPQHQPKVQAQQSQPHQRQNLQPLQKQLPQYPAQTRQQGQERYPGYPQQQLQPQPPQPFPVAQHQPQHLPQLPPQLHQNSSSVPTQASQQQQKRDGSSHNLQRGHHAQQQHHQQQSIAPEHLRTSGTNHGQPPQPPQPNSLQHREPQQPQWPTGQLAEQGQRPAPPPQPLQSEPGRQWQHGQHQLQPGSHAPLQAANPPHSHAGQQNPCVPGRENPSQFRQHQPPSSGQPLSTTTRQQPAAQQQQYLQKQPGQPPPPVGPVPQPQAPPHLEQQLQDRGGPAPQHKQQHPPQQPGLLPPQNPPMAQQQQQSQLVQRQQQPQPLQPQQQQQHSCQQPPSHPLQRMQNGSQGQQQQQQPPHAPAAHAPATSATCAVPPHRPEQQRSEQQRTQQQPLHHQQPLQPPPPPQAYPQQQQVQQQPFPASFRQQHHQQPQQRPELTHSHQQPHPQWCLGQHQHPSSVQLQSAAPLQNGPLPQPHQRQHVPPQQGSYPRYPQQQQQEQQLQQLGNAPQGAVMPEGTNALRLRPERPESAQEAQQQQPFRKGPCMGPNATGASGGGSGSGAAADGQGRTVDGRNNGAGGEHNMAVAGGDGVHYSCHGREKPEPHDGESRGGGGGGVHGGGGGGGTAGGAGVGSTSHSAGSSSVVGGGGRGASAHGGSGTGGSGSSGDGGGDGDKGYGTPGRHGGHCTPGGGRRAAKKSGTAGAADAAGDDDEIIPSANPFLRFTGSPPSAGKLKRGGIGSPAAAAAALRPGCAVRNLGFGGSGGSPRDGVGTGQAGQLSKGPIPLVPSQPPLQQQQRRPELPPQGAVPPPQQQQQQQHVPQQQQQPNYQYGNHYQGADQLNQAQAHAPSGPQAWPPQQQQPPLQQHRPQPPPPTAVAFPPPAAPPVAPSYPTPQGPLAQQPQQSHLGYASNGVVRGTSVAHNPRLPRPAWPPPTTTAPAAVAGSMQGPQPPTPFTSSAAGAPGAAALGAAAAQAGGGGGGSLAPWQQPSLLPQQGQQQGHPAAVQPQPQQGAPSAMYNQHHHNPGAHPVYQQPPAQQQQQQQQVRHPLPGNQQQPAHQPHMGPQLGPQPAGYPPPQPQYLQPQQHQQPEQRQLSYGTMQKHQPPQGPPRGQQGAGSNAANAVQPGQQHPPYGQPQPPQQQQQQQQQGHRQMQQPHHLSSTVSSTNHHPHQQQQPQRHQQYQQQQLTLKGAKAPPSTAPSVGFGGAAFGGAGGGGAGGAGGAITTTGMRPETEYRGRCPFDRCPGVYQPCNAELLWIRPSAFVQAQYQQQQLHYQQQYGGPPPASYEPMGYWRCCRYPECGWRYYPHPRLREPVLSLEIVGDNVFKVMPFPGAEDAVAAGGGVACVMAGAGLDLSPALTREEARRLMRASAVADASTPATAAAGHGATTAPPTGGGSGAAAAPDAAVSNAAALAVVAAGGAATASEAAAEGAPLDAGGDLDDPALYFPLSCYERLLAPLPPHCSLFNAGSRIPEPVRLAYRGQFRPRASPDDISARLQRMPPSLRTALMPFQRQGVEFGLARGGRCLIADEMGVGKTVQAIALASCYEEEWPLLCIVPASLRLVWAEELEKWLPHIRPSHIHVIEGKANRLTGRVARGQALPRITITSYEMMRRLTCPACSKIRLAPPPPPAAVDKGDKTAGKGSASAADGVAGGRSVAGGGGGGGKAVCWGPDRCMAAMPWGMVIVDESHNLRTTNSRDADSPHTEACIAAVARTRRAVLLSGTPSLSRPYDLFRQVDALQPGLIGSSKQAFAFRYCDGRMVPFRNMPSSAARKQEAPSMGPLMPARKRLETSGGSRLVELHGLLTREVMIRRLKRDIMAQLPPKRRQVIRLPYPKSWPDEPNKPPTADAAAPAVDDAGASGDSNRASATCNKGDNEGGGAGGGQRKAGTRGRPAKRAKQGTAKGRVGKSSSGGGGGVGDSGSDSGDEDGGGDGGRRVEEEEEEEGSEDDRPDTDEEGPAAAKRGGAGAGGGGDGSAGPPAATAATAAPPAPPAMSSAHRTALAKLPDAISWLIGALGGAGVAQEGGSGRGGRSKRHASPRDEAPSAAAAANARNAVTAAGGSDAQQGAPPGAAGEGSAGGGGSGLSPPSEQPPKFLVFAHHRDVMDRLAEALQGFDGAEGGGGGDDEDGGGGGGSGSGGGGAVWQGVNYVRIDGSHDSAERRNAVMQFRDDPSVRVALLSITAAAVGLDFSAAAAVVFVELPNEVSLLQQAEDRAHRKGQAHNCVNVYFLCAKGTCDDKRWQKLNESLNNLTQVHDGSAAAEGGHGGAAAAEGGGGADGGHGGAAAGGGAVHRPVRGLAVDAVVDLEEQQEVEEEEARKEGGDAAKDGEVNAAATRSAEDDTAAAAAAAAATTVVTADSSAEAAGDVPASGSPHPGPQAAAASDSAEAVAEGAKAGSGVAAGREAEGALRPADVIDLSAEGPAFQEEQAEEDSSREVCEGGGDGAGGCSGAGAAAGRKEIAETAVAAEASEGETGDMPRDGGGGSQTQQQLCPERTPAKHLLHQKDTSSPHKKKTVSPQGQQPQQLLLTPPPSRAAPLTPGSVTPSRSALLQMLPPSMTFYFEVSCHTGRVHLHLAPDGSRPAGLSLPLELLLAHPGSAMLRGILEEHAKRWRRAGVAAIAAAARNAAQQQQQQQEQLPLPSLPLPLPLPLSPAESPRVPQAAEPQGPTDAGCVVSGGGVAVQRQGTTPSEPPAAAVTQLAQAGGAVGNAAASVLERDLGAAAGAKDTTGKDALALQASPSVQAAIAPATENNNDEDALAAQLSFVGPVGLVAPLPYLAPSQLSEGVAEAAAFARDWRELRAVSKNRLYGAVLERYFQEALDAVTSEAIAAGAYGSSTARYVQDAPMKVPEGATLRPVQVRCDSKFSSGSNGGGGAGAAAANGNGGNGNGHNNGAGGAPCGWRTYQQAFMSDGSRLCLNCSKPVPDCSLPPASHLDNTDYLFCDPACETRYYVKASGSALRRTLARLEHGVCQMCGLDCANLVRQLQTIRTTSRDYLAKRRAVVERLAPRLTHHGYTALLERLLRQASEGLAWQADHITPVYAGGGLCDVDNMRTLCVACHADVTKAQCKQRAAERAQRRLGTRDIRSFLGGGSGGLPPLPNKRKGAGGGGGNAGSAAVVPVHKRRRGVASRAAAYIDTSDDSPSRTPPLPPPPAAVAKAGRARTDVAAAAAAVAGLGNGKKGVKRARGGGGAGGRGGRGVKAAKNADLVGIEDADDNVWEFKLLEEGSSSGDGGGGGPVADGGDGPRAAAQQPRRRPETSGAAEGASDGAGMTVAAATAPAATAERLVAGDVLYDDNDAAVRYDKEGAAAVAALLPEVVDLASSDGDEADAHAEGAAVKHEGTNAALERKEGLVARAQDDGPSVGGTAASPPPPLAAGAAAALSPPSSANAGGDGNGGNHDTGGAGHDADVSGAPAGATAAAVDGNDGGGVGGGKRSWTGRLRHRVEEGRHSGSSRGGGGGGDARAAVTSGLGAAGGRRDASGDGGGEVEREAAAASAAATGGPFAVGLLHLVPPPSPSPPSSPSPSQHEESGCSGVSDAPVDAGCLLQRLGGETLDQQKQSLSRQEEQQEQVAGLQPQQVEHIKQQEQSDKQGDEKQQQAGQPQAEQQPRQQHVGVARQPERRGRLALRKTRQ